MPIDIKVKSVFFDRKAVTDAIGATAAAALSKFGSFVRRTAKSSIRSSKGRRLKGGKRGAAKIGAPGKPPYSHEGSLKRLIFFAWDPVSRSVVIGPTPFRKGEAPSLLEFGGTVDRKRKGKKGGVATLRYRSNPFMGPSMLKEIPNLPQAWSAAVKS